jgi:hypothetical protein
MRKDLSRGYAAGECQGVIGATLVASCVDLLMLEELNGRISGSNKEGAVHDDCNQGAEPHRSRLPSEGPREAAFVPSGLLPGFWGLESLLIQVLVSLFEQRNVQMGESNAHQATGVSKIVA